MTPETNAAIDALISTLRGHGRAQVCTLEPRDCRALAEELERRVGELRDFVVTLLDMRSTQIADLDRLSRLNTTAKALFEPVIRKTALTAWSCGFVKGREFESLGSLQAMQRSTEFEFTADRDANEHVEKLLAEVRDALNKRGSL